MNTKVSVVIPLYNKASSIEKCLRSISKQDYAPHEVIVVNDGSTDNGCVIAEKLASCFDNFIVINQENSGVSVARNVGIASATGGLIFLCDADDLWLQGHVSSLVKAHELYPDSLIYTSQHNVVRGKIIVPPSKSGGGNDGFAEYSENPLRIISERTGIIHSSSVAINSNLLSDFPFFPEGVRIGEDWYVWLKCGEVSAFVFVAAQTVEVNKEFHDDKKKRSNDIFYPLKIYSSSECDNFINKILVKMAKNESFSAVLNGDREKLRELNRYGWISSFNLYVFTILSYVPRRIMQSARAILWSFKGFLR